MNFIMNIIDGAVIRAVFIMNKNHTHTKRSQKGLSKDKSSSEDTTHNKNSQSRKVLTSPMLTPKLKGKEKSSHRTKSKSRKRSHRLEVKQSSQEQRQRPVQLTRKIGGSRKKQIDSQEETCKKIKLFKRTNNRADRSSRSKKEQKRSTRDDTEDTVLERLKAENDYYRRAYLTSKQRVQRLSARLDEQKRRRSSEKEWFRYQINNLKRRLSVDKIRLGHIFTFDSFHNKEVSNMIPQTQNESSSMMAPGRLSNLIADEVADAYSDLSINSR